MPVPRHYPRSPANHATGVVTSLKVEHENSASRIFSNDRDCLAPHVHSRRAKGSVRPCKSEITLERRGRAAQGSAPAPSCRGPLSVPATNPDMAEADFGQYGHLAASPPRFPSSAAVATTSQRSQRLLQTGSPPHGKAVWPLPQLHAPVGRSSKIEACHAGLLSSQHGESQFPRLGNPLSIQPRFNRL
jgi:hypothetical protein